MTLTEQAIATIAAGCEYWPQHIPVTDAELLRIRNECEHNDGQIKIWAKMLQMIVDHVRATRSRLSPATVLALCALAQEALQSRREGQQMREALTEAAETWEHLADDLELGDSEDDECHYEVPCGEPLCEQLGCIIRKRNLARALSHPKPESVK